MMRQPEVSSYVPSCRTCTLGISRSRTAREIFEVNFAPCCNKLVKHGSRADSRLGANSSWAVLLFVRPALLSRDRLIATKPPKRHQLAPLAIAVGR